MCSQDHIVIETTPVMEAIAAPVPHPIDPIHDGGCVGHTSLAYTTPSGQRRFYRGHWHEHRPELTRPAHLRNHQTRRRSRKSMTSCLFPLVVNFSPRHCTTVNGHSGPVQQPTSHRIAGAIAHYEHPQNPSRPGGAIICSTLFDSGPSNTSLPVPRDPTRMRVPNLQAAQLHSAPYFCAQLYSSEIGH